MKKILYVLLPLVVFASLSHAQFSKEDKTYGLPIPTKSFVNDYSGKMLTPAEIAFLNHSLKQYQDSTSSQIVVVILDTLPNHKNGEKWSFEEFTNTNFRMWSPGQKGKNNGVLLLVTLHPKHARIASGTGTEGAIPDVTALNIIRHDMKPQFENGDNYRTVTAGINGIKKALGHEFVADAKSKKADSDTNNDLGLGLVILVVTLGILIVIVIFVKRKDENSDDEDEEGSLIEKRSGRSSLVDDDRSGIIAPILLSDDDKNVYESDDDYKRSLTSSDPDEEETNTTPSSNEDEESFTPGGGDTAGGGADAEL